MNFILSRAWPTATGKIIGQAAAANLIARLDADADLAPTRRRDLISALRSFSRLLDLHPEDVPARHAVCRKRLEGLHPVQAGISPKTLQNLRAGVNAALLRYVAPEPRLTAGPLPPAWADLWQRLSADHSRHNLSRFFRFCAGRDLAPEEVDDAVAQDFRRWLDEETLVRKPETLFKATLQLWNKAVRQVEGWPQCPLTRTKAREGYCLPWEAFPAPLRLEEDGAAAHWRPKSVKRVRDAYGRWLTFLARQDALEADATPAARVTPERVRAYLAELRAQGIASTTLHARLRDLKEALRVMGPEPVPEWLKEATRRLEARATPVRDKAVRVQAADTLFALGLRLMQEARDTPDPHPMRQPARFRDGLMIALLASRPLRLANLVALRIGQNLVRVDDGYWLCFGADETKGKRPYEAPLPEALVLWLELYLARFRPVLLRGSESDHLWISTQAQPMAEITAYGIIRRLGERELGVRLNPHLFRDCVATSIALEDPEHVRITAPLLGHASLTLSTRHYNQARAAEAVRRHQTGLLALRRHFEQGSL